MIAAILIAYIHGDYQSNILEDIVYKAKEEKVKRFMIELLTTDYSLLIKFKGYIYEHLSDQEMKYYVDKAERIINKYISEEGDVDYEEEDYLRIEIKEYVEKDLKPLMIYCFDEAFEIIQSILFRIKEKIVDNEGLLENIASYIFELLESELKNITDVDIENQIFEYFIDLTQVTDYKYKAEEMLFKYFQSLEYKERKINYLHKVLETIDKHSYHRTRYMRYQAEMVKKNVTKSRKVIHLGRTY